jgi:hypothetical protein
VALQPCLERAETKRFLMCPHQLHSDERAPRGWPWKNIGWIDIARIEQELDPEGGEFYHLLAEIMRSVLEELYGLLKHHNWGTAKPSKENVYLAYAYSDTSQLNAYTKRARSGRHIVAIDFTTLLQLQDTYRRLLSNPTVLPDIGVVMHPYTPPALLKFQPTEDGVTRALTAGSTTIKPNEGDAERSACLFKLVRYATTFLFLHELGHIRGCHWDYLHEAWGTDVVTRQMLEYLADIDAMLYALPLILATPVDDAYYKFPLLTVRLWGFATCILFHLIESFASEDSVTASQYPPASRRSLVVNGALRGYPEKY